VRTASGRSYVSDAGVTARARETRGGRAGPSGRSATSARVLPGSPSSSGEPEPWRQRPARLGGAARRAGPVGRNPTGLGARLSGFCACFPGRRRFGGSSPATHVSLGRCKLATGVRARWPVAHLLIAPSIPVEGPPHFRRRFPTHHQIPSSVTFVKAKWHGGIAGTAVAHVEVIHEASSTARLTPSARPPPRLPAARVGSVLDLTTLAAELRPCSALSRCSCPATGRFPRRRGPPYVKPPSRLGGEARRARVPGRLYWRRFFFRDPPPPARSNGPGRDCSFRTRAPWSRTLRFEATTRPGPGPHQ